MSWRGHLDGDPFARSACFDGVGEQAEFYAACDREGSNPERPLFRHAASLLVTEEQLETVLFEERAREGSEGCVEFVLNPRDYPLLSTQGVGPCSLPVLSQYSWDASDLRLPITAEDYARCWPGRRFGRDRRPAEALPPSPPWEMRRACAVFRGAATGAGVTPETNLRLRLVQLSERWAARGHRYQGLLDARLTSWNLRQKIGEDGIVRLLDPQSALMDWGLPPADGRNFLSWKQQASFKYAVYLEGNVGASRLGAMLALGFVVLAPRHRGPCTQLWTLMRPGIHYLEVADDLSDLGEALLWLKANDGWARRVASAAQALWDQACRAQRAEANLAALLTSLPRCSTRSRADFEAAIVALFRGARSGVYCLVDLTAGRLRLFVPFANEAYRNERRWVFQDAGGAEFLRRVWWVAGEHVSLPPSRWWTNGALVCNMPCKDVWGESLFPQLRLLLERAAARLGGSVVE